MANQLLAQLELFCDRLIPAYISGVQVVQKSPALADHHQQPSSGAVILLVLLQVIGQMIDALREQRNLDICRTGIPFVKPEIIDCFCLCFHT